MNPFAFISVGIFILLSSCTTNKEVAMQAAPLFETKWLLKKIYIGNAVEDVQTKAFIRFDKEKQSAGGNGSCNSFGSNTPIYGSEISFKNTFSTKMYCEDVQKTEDTFFKQLEKVNRLEIKDKTLLLYQSEELLLEFESE